MFEIEVKYHFASDDKRDPPEKYYRAASVRIRFQGAFLYVSYRQCVQL